MMNKVKILVLTNIPVSYRVDLFNLLKNSEKYNTRFSFISESGLANRDSICVFSGEQFLEDAIFYKNRYSIIRGIMLLFDIVKDRPFFVVNGGMSLRIIFLCFYKVAFKKKLIVWWAGTSLSEQGGGILKVLYRKIVTKFVDGVIFYSPLALEYYKNLNPHISNYAVIGNNTRDTRKYSQKVMSCKVPKYVNEIVFLTVGFQTAQKNTIAILEAFKMLRKYESKIRLVVAGDGPELPKLKSFCHDNKLYNVEFVGHIFPDDIVEIYAKSDVYIQIGRAHV